MPFASAWNMSQLPEKPWKAGAVVRLLVSVVVSAVMCGGIAVMLRRYFETPQKSSVVYFLALAVITLALVAVALILLARPWPLEEDYLFKLIGLLMCVYGGIF